jgi:hypothetical protein
VVAVAVVGGPLGRVPDAAADEALGTTGLSGNGVVRVAPSEAPGVSVVAWSAPVEGRVAVVVANHTSTQVRVRKVTAGATASSGARAVRASTRRIVPRVLEPGAQALGVITFRRGVPRADDSFAFDVATGRVRGTEPVALATGGFVLSPPAAGDVAQTLDLVVTNDTSTPIDGRVRVQVICLNEAGVPTTAASGTVRSVELTPGASAPASVAFSLLCPVYVVGADGRAPR